MTGSLLTPALVEQLGRLVPGGRRAARGPGGGLHRGPFKGSSLEFRQHRIYAPGDDVRRLDWRVLARTDRPFVREYDDETTRRTLIVLDSSGSMAYGRPAAKMDDACRLAAALAYVALAAGEAAGLLVAGAGDAVAVPPATASTQLARVVDALAHAAAAGPTTLDAAFVRAAALAGRRALVLVVSDLLIEPDGLRRGLARLRHARHDVAVIRVLHPDETDFPFRGWVRLSGLEDPAASAHPAAAVRNAYLDRFAAHERRLREVCRATRADWSAHAVGRPLIDTVRAVVRRGRA